MDEFVKGQRWISEAEPEIGLGSVLSADQRFVEILFPAVKSQRRYAIRSAPLKRVLFKTGDKITDKDSNTIIIETVSEHDGLITYHAGNIKVSETDLSDKISFTSPGERLFSGQADSNFSFELRHDCLTYKNKLKAMDILGLVGPRLDLIPHQFYIAEEVSNRAYPRVLLADEVGLGKTIEACLIIHKLLLSERISRVLIITPEPLVNQWFVELIRKFNMIFSIIDKNSFHEITELNPELNPFEESSQIICSLPFLISDPEISDLLEETEWDIVVVDEAHHLGWSPEKSSPEYDLIELISQKTKGLLLLTATPDQLGLSSHFARLRLLDPDRFYDFDAFIQESKEYQKVASLVEALCKKEKLSKDSQKLLTDLFGESESLKNQITKINQGEQKEIDKVLQSLVDQHGTSRVLFRNTRSAMAAFPKRLLREAALENNTAFIKDSHDLRTLKNNPKIDYLINLLHSLKSEKILLICRTKEMTLALDEVIKSRISIKTALFHENLSLIARDRNAAYFAEPEGAEILICSEIGSEGRNFQFSHHLILFDLPDNPDLLEQRIGRLDRIGQKSDINIHIPYVRNTSQEILFEIYHNGLNAFSSFSRGGSLIFENFSTDIKDALENPAYYFDNNNLKLNKLLNDIRDYSQEIYQKLEKNRDLLLEYNSYRPAVGIDLISKISETDYDKSLENFMNNIFEHFGIEVEDIEPQTYFVSPSSLMFIETFPSLPADGMTITYKRKLGLEREDIEFISWEHPMVTGIIDLLLSSERGNCTLLQCPESSHALLIDAVYVLEAISDKELYAERFLAPVPVRVIINEKSEEIELSEIDSELINIKPEKVFNRPEIARFIKVLLEKTEDIASERSELIIQESLEKMNNTLVYEAKRLIELKKLNPNIRDEEIEFIREQMLNLGESLREARLRLDSIRLIVQGEL